MRKMVARMVSAAALFGIFMNTGALEARGAEIQQERVMTQSWMEAAEMRSRVADISINQQEMDVLYLTNKIRMINGLEPLSTFDRIQAAADIRGSELGTEFSHDRPTEHPVSQRLISRASAITPQAKIFPREARRLWIPLMAGGTVRAIRQI